MRNSAFYLVLTGQQTLAGCLGGFIAPTFVGNVIGGVALVAALAHAELSTTAAHGRKKNGRAKTGTARGAR